MPKGHSFPKGTSWKGVGGKKTSSKKAKSPKKRGKATKAIDAAIRSLSAKKHRAVGTGRPCIHCSGPHTSSQHRSHGVGSFERTHPNAFAGDEYDF